MSILSSIESAELARDRRNARRESLLDEARDRVDERMYIGTTWLDDVDEDALHALVADLMREYVRYYSHDPDRALAMSRLVYDWRRGQRERLVQLEAERMEDEA